MELRDTISALTTQAEEGKPLEAPTETPVESPAPATPEPEGRTAGRARDEQGRLLPGKVEKPEPVVPEIARPPRPSSWKKEMWEHYDKLDPKVAEYVVQRESEYAKGVSTYKTEWDQAKPLIDAITPYQADFQKLGFNPAQAISKLAQTHRDMVAGSPQQRLQLFAKLAQDYQVPLQALYDPQFANQFYQQQQIQQQPQQTETAEQAAKRVYSELRAQDGVTEFGSRKDATGNPAYPHFETVRPKMAQLLESGLAQDLEGAYHAAVKLDDELFQSVQAEKTKADEAKRLEDQRKAVSIAKGNAISPRSATPASSGASAKKGLRGTIEDAFETHTAGRV